MSNFTDSSIETVVESIRQHITSSENFDSALPGFLKLLGEQFACDWAAYWRVDTRTGVLRLAKLWKANSTHAQSLENDSIKRVFSSSECQNGKVWRHRKPIWSDDLNKDMMIPRSLKANEAGLRNGIWFPIYIEQFTFGVIELLMSGSLPEAESLFKVLESLGQEIGEYIEHTQSGSR